MSTFALEEIEAVKGKQAFHTKATQAKDTTLFRKLKKDYINFKQLSDKSPKP